MVKVISSSRPLSGVSIFLLKHITMKGKIERGSRPLSGVSIFLRYMSNKENKENSSRPLSGVSIFLQDKDNVDRKLSCVLVPFPGFLSFYALLTITLPFTYFMFSSPFRGFYLSTYTEMDFKKQISVLVPFPGFLSFYKKERGNELWQRVLVPFPGFLSFY